jgi:hypothetical protein
MDLYAIFQQQQRILELELSLARERFAHYGLRGGAVENAVRDFLERHIPRSLTAGTGEVVASQGDTADRRSGQLDVVISNMLQPFVGPRDLPTVSFIEGVHMAGEVKATIGRANVDDELRKARRFRGLRARNVSRLVQVPEPDNWLSYYVFYRPYFLLSLETSSKWQTILLEVMVHIKNTGLMPLDGVFLLDQNIIILLTPYVDCPFSKLQGIPFNHSIQGRPAVGAIHIYKTDVPLALFLAWTAAFRSSFFDDQHPIGFYISEVLNKAMSDAVLYESDQTAGEIAKRIAALGVFDATIEYLHAAYPKREHSTGTSEKH